VLPVEYYPLLVTKNKNIIPVERIFVYKITLALGALIHIFKNNKYKELPILIQLFINITIFILFHIVKNKSAV